MIIITAFKNTTDELFDLYCFLQWTRTTRENVFVSSPCYFWNDNTITMPVANTIYVYWLSTFIPWKRLPLSIKYTFNLLITAVWVAVDKHPTDHTHFVYWTTLTRMEKAKNNCTHKTFKIYLFTEYAYLWQFQTLYPFTCRTYTHLYNSKQLGKLMDGTLTVTFNVQNKS
jgi:hypothetical protein